MEPSLPGASNNPSSNLLVPILQVLNLLLATLQFVSPFFSRLTGLGRSIEQAAGGNPALSPENPAGYAFSIWFVIFTLSLIYAGYQALPRQRQNPLLKILRPWTAGIFLFSSAWMITAQAWGNGWHLVGLILSMFACTVVAFFKFVSIHQPDNPIEQRVINPLLGLTCGWLTVAIFLNTTSVFKPALINTEVMSLTTFAILTLAPAFILANIIYRRSGNNLWYGLAIIWALIAVTVTNTLLYPNLLMALISVTMLVLIAMTVIMAHCPLKR